MFSIQRKKYICKPEKAHFECCFSTNILHNDLHSFTLYISIHEHNKDDKRCLFSTRTVNEIVCVCIELTLGFECECVYVNLSMRTHSEMVFQIYCDTNKQSAHNSTSNNRAKHTKICAAFFMLCQH